MTKVKLQTRTLDEYLSVINRFFSNKISINILQSFNLKIENATFSFAVEIVPVALDVSETQAAHYTDSLRSPLEDSGLADAPAAGR